MQGALRCATACSARQPVNPLPRGCSAAALGAKEPQQLQQALPRQRLRTTGWSNSSNSLALSRNLATKVDTAGSLADDLQDEDSATDLLEAEEGDFDEDGFEDFQEGAEDDDTEARLLAEGERGPIIDTGAVEWGEVGLAAARRLLASGIEGLEGLELFSFQAITRYKRLDVRLDKLDNEFGSPSLEEIQQFSRALQAEMEAALGEFAGELETEVSSPGAERLVRVPGDLLRFQALPMRVQYAAEDDPARVESKVLELVSVDEEQQRCRWRLADVRCNRESAGKGRRLSKKALSQITDLPFTSLQKVNLYIDI